MVTKIQKWGNSQGLRFPKSLLEEANIAIGDEVILSVRDGKIIVEPVHIVHGRYNIEKLIAEMPADYQVEELDWGSPSGQEEW
jgi:antitoxin MazE